MPHVIAKDKIKIRRVEAVEQMADAETQSMNPEEELSFAEPNRISQNSCKPTI